MKIHNQNNLAKLGLVSTLLLVGCNGGSDGGGGASIPEHQDTFVTASIMDDYALVPLDGGKKHHVDLLSNVKLSDNYNVKVDSVVSLNKGNDCTITAYDESGFVIEGDSPSACDYQYEIVLKDASSGVKLVGDTNGYTRVLKASEPEEIELIPFGVVAFQSELSSISLEEELVAVGDNTSLSGFHLVDDVVVIPSDSSSNIVVDSDKNTIAYTPSEGFVGNERVSYTLINDEGDILAGSFVVTVAEESVKGVEIQELIELDYDKIGVIKVNENKQIDISEFVTNVDDDFQLIYANAFDASVSLVDDEDPQNKSFNFEAPMVGTYFVNVVVTDHRGGYDVGLIEVVVIDPNGVGNWPSLWNTIGDSREKLGKFNAPLTTIDALANGIAYTSGFFDPGVGGEDSSGIWIAAFNYNMAENYCSTIGRLPTVEELDNLVSEKSPSLRGWPIMKPYWTSDLTKVVELNNGVVSSSQNNTSYYVTCVSDGNLEIDNATSIVDDVVADGGIEHDDGLTPLAHNEAKVVAKLLFVNEPVKNQPLRLTISPESEANIESDTLITDEDGVAVFTLTSIKAETFKATVTYDAPTGDGEMSRSVDVRFIGDARSAEVALNVTENLANIYTESNEVTATLTDANDNTVPKEVVSFSSPDSRVSVSTVTPETDYPGPDYSGGNQVAKVTWTDSVIPYDDTEVEVESSYITPTGILTTVKEMVTFLVAEFTELKVTTNNMPLDGGTNVVRAVLKDSDGNGKEGISVDFVIDEPLCTINNQDAVDTAITIKSDAMGLAQANINFIGIPTDYPTGFDCNITATYGKTMRTKPVHFSSYICGGQINDTADNTSGNCIKVTRYRGGYVTSAPSEKFLNETLLKNTSFNKYVSNNGVRRTIQGGYLAMTLAKPVSDSFSVGTGTLCRAYNDLKIAGRTNWKSFRDGHDGQTGFYRISNIFDALGDMTATYNWPKEPTNTGYSNESYYESNGTTRHSQYSLINGRKKSTTVANGYGYYTCYSAN